MQEKSFSKIDFTQNPPAEGEYENCTFTNCDFSNTDFADRHFMDCAFEDCNLSMVKLFGTALQEVAFKKCKMLGLHFENCQAFGLSVRFEDCNLDHSSFFKTRLKKTLFKNTKLIEVDFSGCDLSGAVFDACDLTRATFENSVLEKADLRSAYNFSIDPEKNRIKKAKFSLAGIAGLLDNYDIEIE
ncbi:MAG: pentapeptide repeat-containing protein [Chitinivibrionales bacterium]|nr:pentapeptide repeat-containing protein [Chitinivibrionales bacterium]